MFDSLPAVFLPVPCGTRFGCHGTQSSIHTASDKGCNVGGLVLDYRSTEVRSPWREHGNNGEPPRLSRLLMLKSINTNPVRPSFGYNYFSPQIKGFEYISVTFRLPVDFFVHAAN